MRRKHVGATIILLTVCLAFLVSGCGVFKQPEGKIITEIVAQDVGYLIARENPKLAARILKYMETGPDSISWKSWVMVQLVDDEFLRMNFEKLISLINIDLEGIDNIKERMDIITPILRSFAEGIRVGLRESGKSGFRDDGYLLLADFTWEGELNPNDFDNWKLLFVQPTSQGYFWVFIENPDQTSAIDVVVMEVDLNSMLRSYRYFKYGEPHIYIFDNDQQKYVRHYFTDEQKKSCMKCHSDKPEKDSLHKDMKGV